MSSRGVRRPNRLQYATRTGKLKRSHALTAWLAGSSVLTLGILLILFLSDVRFGQGFFAIRYSPIAGWRLQRAVAMLIVGALACGAVWALAHRVRAYAVVGHVLFALSMVGFGAFAWGGPPDAMNQQTFNMTSLSTDGAFVYEGRKFESVVTYLREFPDVTLRKTPAEMGGTRVLSNPPLSTVVAYWVYRAASNPPESPGGCWAGPAAANSTMGVNPIKHANFRPRRMAFLSRRLRDGR